MKKYLHLCALLSLSIGLVGSGGPFLYLGSDSDEDGSPSQQFGNGQGFAENSESQRGDGGIVSFLRGSTDHQFVNAEYNSGSRFVTRHIPQNISYELETGACACSCNKGLLVLFSHGNGVLRVVLPSDHKNKALNLVSLARSRTEAERARLREENLGMNQVRYGTPENFGNESDSD